MGVSNAFPSVDIVAGLRVEPSLGSEGEPKGERDRCSRLVGDGECRVFGASDSVLPLVGFVEEVVHESGETSSVEVRTLMGRMDSSPALEAEEETTEKDVVLTDDTSKEVGMKTCAGEEVGDPCDSHSPSNVGIVLDPGSDGLGGDLLDGSKLRDHLVPKLDHQASGSGMRLGRALMRSLVFGGKHPKPWWELICAVVR